MQLKHFAILAILALTSLAHAEEKKFYDPVEKEIEGWVVKVDPAMLLPENREKADLAFEALANHLQRIKYIMPKEQLASVRKLPIWIELNGELSNMQYHPDRLWLLAEGHDPRLVKHVHIPRAENLTKSSTWAKHPYVVLHELAHAYHDQALSFKQPDIIAAYEEAKKRGIYDNVISHSGRRVEHYSMTTPMEYFAESTEAYFGVNDFYPFVRAELKEHDPRMYALMQRFWGKIR